MIARQRNGAISKLTISVLMFVLLLLAVIGLYLTQMSPPKPEETKPQVPRPVVPTPSKGPVELPPPTTVIIKAVSASEFRPSFVHVSVGSTIIWDNVDKEVHTATSNNVTTAGEPLFHSVLKPGDKFEFKFDKPGTYYFLCVVAYHTMNGIVKVSG
jgi:plastocyanin